MKILAFGASTSKNSINKTFASFTASQFENTDIEVLDLNDFDLPIFNVDLEKEKGIPENAILFYNKLKTADLIIISLAEHNGTYTAAFKNLFDWVSRYKLNMFEDKKILLLSTATGPRGGLGAMQSALSRFPIHGAKISGNFTLPKFQTNFDYENGIINEDLKIEFNKIIEEIKNEVFDNKLYVS